MPPRRSRTNGVERAFQILEHLTATGESATAYQIAKSIGAPLSTIYESIALLEKMEILTRYGDDGKFFLGPRLIIYGLAFQRHLEAEDIYRREIENLSRETGENVQIHIREGDFIVVAGMVQISDQYQLSSRPGSRTPATWTASGQLLTGHLTPEERREIFLRCKPQPSGRVTTPEEWEKHCAESWERGWSRQPAESDFAISCIAAPILNPMGQCVCTIAFILPEAAAVEKEREYVDMILAGAANIKRSLGWHNFTGKGLENVWRVS